MEGSLCIDCSYEIFLKKSLEINAGVLGVEFFCQKTIKISFGNWYEIRVIDIRTQLLSLGYAIYNFRPQKGRSIGQIRLGFSIIFYMDFCSLYLSELEFSLRFYLRFF